MMLKIKIGHLENFWLPTCKILSRHFRAFSPVNISAWVDKEDTEASKEKPLVDFIFKRVLTTPHITSK